jgi:integrase/recombinase XerD
MKQAPILSKSEYKRLLSATKLTRHADRNRIAVVLSFAAGLRACEIAAITIGDVVDSNGEVKSQAFLKKHQVKGNESGTIYLSDAVRKEISSFIAKYPHRLNAPSNALLQSQKSGSFSSKTIQHIFKKLFVSIGLGDCSSHSGRRTLLTNASNAGISIRVIQSIARHRHLNTTARYLSVTDTQISAAVNLVGI